MSSNIVRIHDKYSPKDGVIKITNILFDIASIKSKGKKLYGIPSDMFISLANNVTKKYVTRKMSDEKVVEIIKRIEYMLDDTNIYSNRGLHPKYSAQKILDILLFETLSRVGSTNVFGVSTVKLVNTIKFTVNNYVYNNMSDDEVRKILCDINKIIKGIKYE